MPKAKRHFDAHYTNPRLAEIYDACNPWSADNDFYLSLAGTDPIRILDLGCGTGLLCDAYAARGHQITGVDPAEGMLQVARTKANAHKVKWVQAEAQVFSSETRYDLILMTGHAFQVLLDESDVLAVFGVMRCHLANFGKVAFETRNPDLDWASRWNRTFQIHIGAEQVSIEQRSTAEVNQRIQLETVYRFTDETLISRSTLRFWTLTEIQQLLAKAGLKIVNCFGDWGRSSFDAHSSEEMIFVAEGSD